LAAGSGRLARRIDYLDAAIDLARNVGDFVALERMRRERDAATARLETAKQQRLERDGLALAAPARPR
jgi:hypothetical protein